MTNGNRPPELQAILDLLQGGAPFASIEEAQRAVNAQMRGYNSRPQADLGGLSPDQMQQLLYGDWKSTGALRLNERLTLDDLSAAAMLADARTLLEYVRDEGPVKETAAHNLSRAAVAALVPRLRMPREVNRAYNLTLPRQTNEGDVPWLQELRHVLLFGKLLARRKGMRIAPLGRALLAPERAGKLYAHLFFTFFRTLNLSVLGGRAFHADLQPTLAYSLFMLRTATKQWTSPQDLAESSWLESAKDPPDALDAAYGDMRFITFQLRVLDPLAQFGLLEFRPLPNTDAPRYEVEYRRTPLYSRFLRFEFHRP